MTQVPNLIGNTGIMENQKQLKLVSELTKQPTWTLETPTSQPTSCCYCTQPRLTCKSWSSHKNMFNQTNGPTSRSSMSGLIFSAAWDLSWFGSVISLQCCSEYVWMVPALTWSNQKTGKSLELVGVRRTYALFSLVHASGIPTRKKLARPSPSLTSDTILPACLGSLTGTNKGGKAMAVSLWLNCLGIIGMVKLLWGVTNRTQAQKDQQEACPQEVVHSREAAMTYFSMQPIIEAFHT